MRQLLQAWRHTILQLCDTWKQEEGRRGCGSTGTPDDMQNRIDRLEGLVLSLMGSNGAPGATAAAQAAIDSSRSNSLATGPQTLLDVEGADMIREEGPNGQRPEDDSEVEQVSKGIGIMKVDNGRAVFASDAHWYAILGEISEVKNYFNNHKEDYKAHMQKVQAAKADESPGTAFLLQGPASKSRDELLNDFPAKTDADRLIARYFNAYDPSVHIIHGPSFQKQYDRHWLNPHETSVVWLGLCYAMMTLALQSYNRAGDEPPEYRGRTQELSHAFRRLTAQSLLLADITQPIPQVLETLILHVTAEYGRSRDAEPGVLFMVGICVRLAMRMGYHRDPAPHPQISPFQGEMRRRVWTFIRVTDLLISFQFGLPAVIKTDQIDTEHPRNLYDDELHEEMKSLPPSRPTFEATPMSYMIAKSKMTFLFGEIVERTQSIKNPPSYEETMKFDAMLREQRSTHPPLLQMRSFQESARDPANLIMQRLGLEMVYLRSLFVLHRRFIAKGRENPRYACSRRTCIDASMQLLEHQATLHSESQPGGRLRSVKWYISSLTTHDFLLAAMLVCLDLYHHAESERRGQKPGAPTSPIATDLYAEDRRDEMLRAVEHCITIWEAVREQSMEAYKASIALRVMVEKLKAHQRAMQTQQASFSVPNARQYGRTPHFGAFPTSSVGDMNTDDLPPEQSAAMTLGMLSSGGISPGPNFAMSMAQQQTQMQTTGEKQPGYPASMAALLNEPMPERTGLTPQYPGPDAVQAMSGPASPFSQMLATAGQANGFMGMEGLGGDVDWGAWDQYIQGNSNLGVTDPSQMGWPMPLDPAIENAGQQPNGPGNPSGVFMGAITPNGMMG
ncbi:Zn(II)2Cys6 transcription factor-like protein [Teratosphaeria destructans]|uniref:Zn(II)2Cys6 transcription factor-like protein n=1 Tax=Teratosphaeria destructans TaxID=418781 RepID=A0A9W7VYC5_9PEZI|nr:Zn(II)2Cys6 transcription factor-like protein [Teratosphaeria destructans]